METAKSERLLRFTVALVEFIILFIFWLILSGHYSFEYIILGLFCSALTTFLTYETLFKFKGKYDGKVNSLFILRCLLRIFLYVPWLLWEIIKANLQVAYLILHPKLPINPVILVFKTHHKWNVTKVTLANSITLTPGTITIFLEENKYVVHAITPSSAGDIENTKLINKAGRVFCEETEQTVDINYIYSIGEVDNC